MTADLFGERFYGHREPAWHKLGIVTQEDMTAVEVFSALGGYWFEKRPVTVTLNGEAQEVGDFAIVRSATPDDPKERLFGYTTDRYNILQPLEICEIFDEMVKQPVETMGMLEEGKKIFSTWILPEINVNGDQVLVYGFIACGYDGKFGSSLSIVTTRVVCKNTFNIAIMEAANNKVEGRGRVWSGKHNSPNMKRDFAIWLEHVQQQAEEKVAYTQELFCKMAKTPVSKPEAEEIIWQVYPDPDPLPASFPSKLRAEKQTRIDEMAQKADRDRKLVANLFDGAGTAIDPNGWGLLNAFTEYENYGRMTKKPADVSIMMGNRANAMTRACNAIEDFCKK